MLSEILADEIDVAGPLVQIALGLGAGIIGGIVGFHYQRRHDRMAATAEARRHYRARLTGRMDDIVTFWNAENASGLSFEPVQKKFEVFDRRISKDLSSPPVPLRPAVMGEFQTLIAAMNRVGELDPAAGDTESLRDWSEAVVETAERIRSLHTEWFVAK